MWACDIRYMAQLIQDLELSERFDDFLGPSPLHHGGVILMELLVLWDFRPEMGKADNLACELALRLLIDTNHDLAKATFSKDPTGDAVACREELVTVSSRKTSFEACNTHFLFAILSRGQWDLSHQHHRMVNELDGSGGQFEFITIVKEVFAVTIHWEAVAL